MNQLTFTKQINFPLSSNRKHIEGVFPILNPLQMICVRQGYELLGFEFQSESSDWKLRWREKVFSSEVGNYPKSTFPWFVSNELNVVMILHPEGVKFYQPTQSKLQLQAKDGNFHEVYGFGDSKQTSLLFGKFYQNLNQVGVMARNKRGDVRFYAAFKESLENTQGSDPLFMLNRNLYLSPDWRDFNTNFFLTNFDHGKASTIGLRTTSSLEFYQFDHGYNLKKVFETKQIKKSPQDCLIFADLTHQFYQDILLFNSSGMFVFMYEISNRDFFFLHHDLRFSESNGWLRSYDESIIIADINQDNRDDLIFTGSRGLTALTFDHSEWKMILDPETLSGRQRFSLVVDVLKVSGETSMLLQDQDGNIQWVKVKEGTMTTSRPPEVTTLESTSTVRVQVDSRIPKKISREFLSSKPSLRWAEQLNPKLFKSLIDTASGQVRFTLPLIDTSIFSPWNLKLDLSYSSQTSESDLLGEGWTIPLAQDFIFVDFQGSIFEEDAQYYLVMQGLREKIKILSQNSSMKTFELESVEDKDNSKDKISIHYDLDEEIWIIEGRDEKVFYGEALTTLGWANWRGQGSDKKNMQPYVTAWFLSSRESKGSQRKLNYTYEKEDAKIGSSTYTKSMRLKSIKNNESLSLIFEYEQKSSEEFEASNPVNEDGRISFPIVLSNSHYLKNFELTTAELVQKIDFIYKLDNKRRFLTSIKQSDEKVLQFEYQNVSMTSVITPTGLKVEFTYTSTFSLKDNFDLLLTYPIREKTKISFGPDYSILASKIDDQIVLKIMNHGLTKIIDELTIQQIQLEEFSLNSFNDSFILVIQSTNSRCLHFYERNENRWIKVMKEDFDKEALMSFSENLIAVGDANELKIYQQNASWTRTMTIFLNKPLTRLTHFNNLIIGYDDKHLKLFFKEKSNFRTQSLASDLGDFQQIFEKFELENEKRKEFVESFNRNGLQILNNFIALSSLYESNNQLILLVHLFLLNKNFELIKTQSFDFKQENILKISQTFKSDGSEFVLKYRKVNNRFHLYIDSASGEVVKEINKISNRNLREDKMRELLKELNDFKEWKEVF